MKRAAAYARVSTDHQSKETSIEAQFDIIRQYAAQNGIEIVAEYYDKDSGGKSSRPQFDEMIRRALEGKFNLILVDKYDRFFREGVEDQRITKLLEQRGVQVIAVLEPVDPSTPAGWFARWIFSGMYEMQRRYIAEETKRKMRFAAKKGYWMGGVPPYGFKVVEVKDSEGKVRKKLVPDENEASVVREIFRMYAEGLGLAQVASELNKRGIKTRRGGEWTKSSLYELLRNEKYIGIYTYAKGTKKNHRTEREDLVKIEGAIEPIIDKELWEKVNVRIKERRYVSGVSKHNYLLRGLAVCGLCGAPMVGTPQKRGKVPAYVCSSWKEKKAHEYVGMSKKKLEGIVDAFLETKLFINEIDFEQLAKELNELERYRALADNSRHQAVLERIKELDKEIESYLEVLKKGYSIDAVATALQKAEEEKKRLEVELQALERSEQITYTPEILKAQWERLKQLFKSINEEDKRLFYTELIEKVVVYPTGYVDIVLK